MGRKRDAHDFALASGRQPVTRRRLLAYVGVGFAAGMLLGLIFMGTMHAVRASGCCVGGRGT